MEAKFEKAQNCHGQDHQHDYGDGHENEDHSGGVQRLGVCGGRSVIKHRSCLSCGGDSGLWLGGLRGHLKGRCRALSSPLGNLGT